jgi:ankyrin repeat protein
MTIEKPMEQVDWQARLLAAIHAGVLPACSLALDNGADPNCTYYEAIVMDGGMDVVFVNSLLDLAIVKGFDEGALLLLDRGASPRALNPGDDPPLITAVSRNNVAICEALLAKGAAVDDDDGQGGTALTRAAEALNVRLCEVLIANGADVHAWRPNWGTPLHIAARRVEPQASDVIRTLVAGGASPGYVRTDSNEINDDLGGMTPFECAVGWGRPHAVRCFLDLGEDPTQTTSAGRPIISFAGTPETAEVLRAALTAQVIETAATDAAAPAGQSLPPARVSLGPI